MKELQILKDALKNHFPMNVASRLLDVQVPSTDIDNLMEKEIARCCKREAAGPLCRN